MTKADINPFPSFLSHYQGLKLPEMAQPVGYAALIEVLGISAPLPRRLTAIAQRHRTYTAERWQILTPRYQPKNTVDDHLLFALRHEGVDLGVLKRVFLATGPKPIEVLVAATPTGAHARRLWFLYEWLIGQRLALPDAKQGSYARVLDEKKQFAVKGLLSKRHRIRNNLPGTPEFCPLVFRTDKLETLLKEDLATTAQKIIAEIPKDVLARTAAFMLLKDTQSSFDIEGETASHTRIQRWGQAIAQAGNHPITVEELLRLQEIVIGDNRFVDLGLRTEGGFVGEHDRRTGEPLPDHISARHEDLGSLMTGLLRFSSRLDEALDPVMVAAIIAFGFVYIHPFEDGNGRLHRYLIHHVLAERGFAPPGVVFPVSAVILERIAAYRSVLEQYSQAVLPFIEWTPTGSGNVQVLNDTADFYRFFDATPQVEFLFDCIKQTIEVELPNEARFLKAYDTFRREVQKIVDMPERTLNLLFRFLHQNDGQLSKRARSKEFSQLSEAEVAFIEVAYGQAYDRD